MIMYLHTKQELGMEPWISDAPLHFKFLERKLSGLSVFCVEANLNAGTHDFETLIKRTLTTFET